MQKRDAARHLLVDSRHFPALLPEAAGRLLDLGVALCALVLLSPLMAMTALLVASQGDGPILFRHLRIGRGGRRFQVMKFRTMPAGADAILANHLATCPEAAAEWARDHKLKNDPRVTSLGSFLRRSSLDELPQIMNVIMGEMSIVGPRPIVEAEVVRYGQFFNAYCSVRPGITGIWQVSGRNDVSYERRVQMDALYARRKSVFLDLRLMVATVPAVLLRRGSC